MGLVTKAQNDWCRMFDGLKLQCIAIAIFANFLYLNIDTVTYNVTFVFNAL